MKKYYLSLVVIGLVILLALMTNPNQERHKEVIKNKINLYMQKSLTDNLSKNYSEAGQALGLMIGGAFADRLVDNIISTDNYLLFSLTKLSWEGEMKTIGIGAFGNVFLTDKLDQALSKGLTKDQQ